MTTVYTKALCNVCTCEGKCFIIHFLIFSEDQLINSSIYLSIHLYVNFTCVLVLTFVYFPYECWCMMSDISSSVLSFDIQR